MRSPLRALTVGFALTCLTVVGTTSTAHAADGQLTLSSGSASRTILYDTCQPPRQFPFQQFQIDAFHNQPSPGCQALLINQAGASTVLCVGRGTVPAEFRQVRLVQLQPGTAPPCGFGTTSTG
ncbi:hypothetical protein FAF44_36245 [Nonomuraea sp. MG754425]|uniref:hypothetical protein n=1 Tax=Nonomuraea sp. MG754425 TaxID=2570319 RepID=UPI001F26B9BA|nr:hypothetical protein [Nonomuraea sp. MG754425]MCF6473796.1 hypothetical protein [Nonomuraea sp. MG754425]